MSFYSVVVEGARLFPTSHKNCTPFWAILSGDMVIWRSQISGNIQTGEWHWCVIFRDSFGKVAKSGCTYSSDHLFSREKPPQEVNMIRLEVSEILSKPINTGQLLFVIEKALKRRKTIPKIEI